jgi:hypothetical protein
MMKIEFVLRGRSVTLDEVEDVRARAMLREIERSIRDRVGGLRCAEHDAYPKLTATGSAPDDLEFELAGCCSDLLAKTTAALQ